MMSCPVQKRLIIHNLPYGGVVLTDAIIWELYDTSANDKGGLSPGEDLASMYLWLYPDLGKRIGQPDKAKTFNLNFGKRTRRVGDNKGKF